MLRKNNKLELLKSVPLFAGCSKKELGHISRIADEIDFKPGEVLIREGSAGREFFVLVDGTVEVRRSGRKLKSLDKGDFFGELALLGKIPRTATVTTTSPVDALVISARDFERMVGSNPLIALKVIRALVERLPEVAF